MNDIALQFNHVWKKFKRGEKYDSLRDLIPAMTKRLFKGNSGGELQEKEFWALKDVSFEVKRGEALGIIGPNGAGKSTILKVLSGILKPNKGQMKVNGRLSALIEVGAGFHPDLTGRENVYLNGAILGMKKSQIDKKFDEIVEFSGISEFIDTPVKRYSSGMNARLGFSVAAHMDPDVLLVDEVLSVGDLAFQRKCLEKMESFVHNGVTIIFISHNLQSVSSLCSRVLLLNHGSVAAIGKTDDVIRYYLRTVEATSCENDRKNKVWISKVDVKNQVGRSVSHFKSGEKASITIEISSEVNESNFAVGIAILDERNQSVFYTSSERLGVKSFFIRQGETINLTFDCLLHLTTGTYYLRVRVKRYDIGEEIDVKFPAATLLIDCDEGIGGIANLYPIIRSSKNRYEI